MPKTLFVVDDSATMRKVFELTFAGEDISLVTHDGTDGAVARAREVRPNAAIVDVSLGNQQSGYDLVKALRGDAESGGYPIFVLHSDHSPLDEVAARAAGASGALVKPFETQVMIDRVRQVLAAGAPSPQASAPQAAPGAPGAPGAPRPPVPAAPAATPGPVAQASAIPPRPKASTIIGTALPPGMMAAARAAVPGTSVTPPAAPPAPPRAPAAPVPVAPAAVAAPSPAARAAAAAASMPAITLEDSDEELQLEPGLLADLAPPGTTGASGTAARGVAQPARQVTPARAAPAVAPRPAPAAAPAPAPAAAPALAQPPMAALVAAPVAAPVAAAPPAGPAPADTAALEIARRVASLGLTAAQVDAVSALTREVVERVVWEVVPALAETLIREEIRRLTAEPADRN